MQLYEYPNYYTSKNFVFSYTLIEQEIYWGKRKIVSLITGQTTNLPDRIPHNRSIHGWLVFHHKLDIQDLVGVLIS